MEPPPESDTEKQQTPHPMRRRDRELSTEETKHLLRQGEYGILCTCGEQSVPYGVPVNYVYDGERISFHSAAEGHKVQNLRENARASFTVVNSARVLPHKFSCLYESAIAFGRVIEAEGEDKRAILQALVKKYSPNHQEEGTAYIARDINRVCVFTLQIDHISGKAHR